MTMKASAAKVFSNNKYSIEIDWTAKADIPKNSSQITVDLYVRSRTGWHIMTGSVKKDMYINVNGQTHDWSNTIAITKNQRKHLGGKTFTVKHDTNGNYRLKINYGINLNARFDGVWYNWLRHEGSSWALDQIHRKSTLSNASLSVADYGSWVFNIKRSNGGFKHTLHLDIQNGSSYPNIFGQTGIGTSYTKTMNRDERLKFYTAMAGRMSAAARVNLVTFNGSTNLGTTTKTGKATVSTGTIAKIDVFPTNWDITTSPKVHIKDVKIDKDYTYDISFTLGSRVINRANVRPFEGATTGSFEFKLSATETSQLVVALGNAKTGWGQFKIQTKFRGVNVGVPQTAGRSNLFLNKATASPVISGSFGVVDGNAQIVALTKDSGVFVQSKSKLQINIPAGFCNSRISGKIESITVRGAGQEKNIDYIDPSKAATIVFDKTLDHTVVGLVPITVTVYDNRGFSAQQVKNINVSRYSSPTIKSSGGRRYGYDSLIQLKTAITYTAGTFGKLATSLKLKTVTWAKVGGSESGSAVFKAYTENGKTTVANVIEIPDLENTSSFEVTITIGDGLVNVAEKIRIGEGRPIMFLDAKRKSMGVNMFPDKEKMIQVSPDTSLQVLDIRGSDSNMYVLKDHSNTNVSLSATGGDLYIGYKNTKKIRISSPVYSAKTGNKLYDHVNNTLTPENLFIGKYADTEGKMTSGIEIRSSSSSPYIDFYTSANDGDYTSRIMANSEKEIEIIATAGLKVNSGSILRSNTWGFAGTSKNMYIAPKSGGALMIKQNDWDGAWAPIQASKFEPKSSHSLKKDFKTLPEDEGIRRIRETDIVEFVYKDYEDERVVGFVINDDGRSPYKTDPKLFNVREIDGEKDYSYDVGNVLGTSMLAIKKLDKELEAIKQDNKNLRTELKSYMLLFENGVLTPSNKE